MNRNEILKESAENIFASGTKYASVDISGGDYTTDDPFKAIIAGAAGNVEIVGIDGAACVIPVQEGLNPYGGSGILSAGTTATGLIIIR